METIFGQLITDGNTERDAIHVAAIPVIANMNLKPGTPIGYVTAEADAVERVPRGLAIGIVDPFLEDPVKIGQRFWMFLMPRTITSLKHQWTHPAVDGRREAKEQLLFGDSKKRLRDFANQVGLDYDELMQHAQEYARYGEYLNQGSRFEGAYIYDDFWKDYIKVTGEDVPPGSQDNFFTCSC